VLKEIVGLHVAVMKTVVFRKDSKRRRDLSHSLDLRVELGPSELASEGEGPRHRVPRTVILAQRVRKVFIDYRQDRDGRVDLLARLDLTPKALVIGGAGSMENLDGGTLVAGFGEPDLTISAPSNEFDERPLSESASCA
jgi:hypothetical protein